MLADDPPPALVFVEARIMTESEVDGVLSRSEKIISEGAHFLNDFEFTLDGGDPLLNRADYATVPEILGHTGYANDRGSFRAHAVTRPGPLSEITHERVTITWTGLAIKQPESVPFEIHVNPGRLQLLDGSAHEGELVAVWALDVRITHGGLSRSAFNADRWIEGRGILRGSGHVLDSARFLEHYRIVAEADDVDEPIPVAALLPIWGVADDPPSWQIVGAAYHTPPHSGVLDLSWIPDGQQFQIDYHLTVAGIGYGVDTFAEAQCGDPLRYGTGVSFRYSDFGEFLNPDEFRITSLRTTGGAVQVRFPSHDGFYYVLCRGGDLVTIDDPIVAWIGEDGVGQLEDPTPLEGRGFYRVKRLWMEEPEDTDGDGIDDVFEILHSSFLDFADPEDAGRDQDGDGLTNRVEYDRGSDPEVPDAPPAPERHYPGILVDTGLRGTTRLGDVNGDGLLDAVALGGAFGAAALETALANPDGTFQSPVSTALGDLPVLDLEVADLNGDRFADAAVVAGDSIVLATGKANGTFDVADSHAFGSVASVAVGDVDGDGRTDLLLLRNLDKSVVALKGTGDGTFQPLATWTFLSTPLDAAVALFNDDSFPDLVVSLQAGQVAVLLGSEGGLQDPAFYPCGASPVTVATGDVNNDGIADIVTANRSSDNISVLLLQEDGIVGSQTFYATADQPSGLQARDFDGDDKIDVLVSHSSSPVHRLFRGDGAGSFIEQDNLHTSAGLAIAGDWDGDGIDDLVTPAGSGSGLFLVSLGNGDGTFDTRRGISLPTSSFSPLSDVLVADLDADGEAELLMVNTTTNSIDVWEHGLLETDARFLYSLNVPAAIQAITVGDVDGDTRPDVIVASAVPSFGGGTNQLTVFRNDGGTFSLAAEIPLGASFNGLILAELDGAGGPDLLATVRNDNFQTPENEVQAVPLLNSGSLQFAAGTALLPGDQINRALARDLDGDGVDEVILSGHFGVAAIVVYARSGDGTWTERQRFDTNVSDLGWADTDSDGAVELVTVQVSPGTGRSAVQSYPLTTGGINPPNLLLEADDSARSLRVADIDGDSTPDLLLGTGSLAAIHFGASGGGWSSDPDRYYTGGTEIRLKDLTGDDRPEIISWGGSSTVGLLIHR